MTWIALLRGVNVTGHGKIPMAALRSLCSELGLRDVRTYVQSGNVVFRSDATDGGRLSKKLGDAIEAQFGFRPRVMLRTAEDLRAVMARNPFPEVAADTPGRLIVMFLESDPGDAGRGAAEAFWPGPERLRASGCEVFIDYPNGQGQSKLTLTALEKALGRISFTGRNWNSVTKLLEMAAEAEGLQ